MNSSESTKFIQNGLRFVFLTKIPPLILKLYAPEIPRIAAE